MRQLHASEGSPRTWAQLGTPCDTDFSERRVMLPCPGAGGPGAGHRRRHCLLQGGQQRGAVSGAQAQLASAQRPPLPASCMSSMHATAPRRSARRRPVPALLYLGGTGHLLPTYSLVCAGPAPAGTPPALKSDFFWFSPAGVRAPSRCATSGASSSATCRQTGRSRRPTATWRRSERAAARCTSTEHGSAAARAQGQCSWPLVASGLQWSCSGAERASEAGVLYVSAEAHPRWSGWASAGGAI